MITELRDKAQQYNLPSIDQRFDIGMGMGIEIPEDVRKKMEDEMKTTQRYPQGTMDALNEAADAINKYREQIKDPVMLLSKVKEFAESLQQQAQEAQHQAQANLLTRLNLASLVVFPSRAGSLLYDAGYAQGQHTAAATIDWFFGK